jgi:hypothetical protein
MGETLMQQRRVKDEGIFVVNFFSEGINMNVPQE